jgi:hypothetical protein
MKFNDSRGKLLIFGIERVGIRNIGHPEDDLPLFCFGIFN